jgi:hypothetical protein
MPAMRVPIGPAGVIRGRQSAAADRERHPVEGQYERTVRGGGAGGRIVHSVERSSDHARDQEHVLDGQVAPKEPGRLRVAEGTSDEFADSPPGSRRQIRHAQREELHSG